MEKESEVRLARNAMATRFEILLRGPEPLHLRAAGEEALNEIQRVEAELSIYEPTSILTRVNATAHRESVPVPKPVFDLLSLARELSDLTQRAFDPTIGPLLDLWGLRTRAPRLAQPSELAEAQKRVGMDKVILDSERLTVAFAGNGMSLDLGSIGKGYAIEKAVEVLRENGVEEALVHGGTSTVASLSLPGNENQWVIALDRPPAGISCSFQNDYGICLNNNALSVSAVWGKSFQAGSRQIGHVLDPRTGQPVAGSWMAAVSLNSPTLSDALSTALLVGGSAIVPILAERWPGLSYFLVHDANGEPRIEARGFHSLSRSLPREKPR